MTDFKNTVNALEAGLKEEKIKILESLSNSKDPD